MTKQPNDGEHTDSKQGERELSPAEKRLREGAGRVPHPGTVRVTIFPNPRGRRIEIKEDKS